jgi:tRNA-specific 2-thiouridylase
MQKSQVRAEAARLGLRTWDKPDSQDVCFIEASKGRAVFLGNRMTLTPATIVDGATGEVVGSTETAELMTVGQRRGVVPGRGGEKRYVKRVDIAQRRVEVGRLDEILISSISLEGPSLSFSHEVMSDATPVLAQWSAHGRAQPATLRHDGAPRWWLALGSPARPVAAGQSVVLYRADEPTIVEGAAIVAAP